MWLFPKAEKTTFPAVQALRGIASLAVCWFHLTTGNGLFKGSVLGQSGAYGWLGVEAFFVISGFIIPYTMLAGGYRPSNFLAFLAKRIVRVDPPYIVSYRLNTPLHRPRLSFGIIFVI